jgi:hypothetical protein
MKRLIDRLGGGRLSAQPAAGVISERDVIQGYTWLLGRVPPTDEIKAAQQYFGGDLQAFQNGLLISEEFRNRRIGAAQHMRIAPVDVFRKKIILLHIEKCGGTTLRLMLESQFEPSRVCPERFNGLADWTANELACYDVLAGHFDLAQCHVVPGRQNEIITMLREPKARLLSLFHFWRASPPRPGVDDGTLVDLARRCSDVAFFSHPGVIRHPSIRDAMAGQLTRKIGDAGLVDGYPRLRESDPILAAPAVCLEAAWEGLVGLTSFGLVEQYDLSRLLLNRVLGLTMQGIAPQQVGTRPARVEKELDALLDAITPIDRALYQRAVELFKARVFENPPL